MLAVAGWSNKLGSTEGCRAGEPGQRSAEPDSALYSRGPSEPFQEAKVGGGGQTRSAMEKCRTFDGKNSMAFHWSDGLGDTNNPPQLPGLCFKEIDDRLSKET